MLDRTILVADADGVRRVHIAEVGIDIYIIALADYTRYAMHSVHHTC